MRKETKSQDGLDWTYITSLTREMVGENTLAHLIASSRGECDAWALALNLGPLIEAKVDKWRDETAGRVAGYATARGNPHDLDLCRPQFINRTGSAEVLKMDFFDDHRPGAQLRKLAVATVVCTLRDIILQDRWQAEWEKSHGEKVMSEVDGN